MKTPALWGKEDIAASQNQPHVFLIGLKHRTNPSMDPQIHLLHGVCAPLMRGSRLVSRVSNMYSCLQRCWCKNLHFGVRYYFNIIINVDSKEACDLPT